MDLGPGAYLAICAVILLVLVIARQVRLRKEGTHFTGIGDHMRSLLHDSSFEWGDPPEGGEEHVEDPPQATSGGSDAA